MGQFVVGGMDLLVSVVSHWFGGTKTHHELFSSVLRNVDDFVALDVAVGRIPVDGQSGDGGVGHLHVPHSAQRHWWGGQRSVAHSCFQFQLSS